MSRLLITSLAALAIALVPATLRAFDAAEPAILEGAIFEGAAAEPQAVEPAEVDVEEPFDDGMMPANWTHVGCISLSSQCLDVFADNNGDLWVCKACGTTNRPGPGKCRRLTQYEIDHALWCA